MRKINFRRAALGSVSVVGMALAFTNPAFAQTGVPAAQGQPAPDCDPDDPADQDCPPGQSEVEIESGTRVESGAQGEGTITVTGSRIRRPNVESQVPITSVGGEEFFETGNIAIGDTLNELPQLRSTLGQQQSAVTGLGNAGLNLLDLRGLGTQRTLVLLNGRRHVPADVQLNTASPDINSFPTALIQRVDVVTGGNSAIYGSDAIAGVVNFITRRDFEGVEVRGQAGVSQYGDAGAYFASFTAGTNFGDDRGNIAVSIEYGHQDRYFGVGRPNLRQNDNFIVVDTDPTGSPNGSDGIPDNQFFRDIRSTTVNNTGLITFNNSPTATQNCGTDPVGNFYNCPFQFQPDGTLVPITGTRVGLGPNGSFIGGNGENFRGGEELELAPNVDRIVGNLLAHFTFSEAFEPFLELKYSKIESTGSGNTGPGFIISAGNGADVRQTPRLDNPFLSTQARNLIRNTLLTTGRSTGTVSGVGGALTAADIAAINNGSFRLRIFESFLNLGRREQSVERETYRAVAGVRGGFNTDWSYEISANYGEYKESDVRTGNINRQRLLLALDAAIDPANPGAGIQCRSRFDPAARLGLPTPAIQGLPAAVREPILAADIAACVPINIFGGNFSQAQADYLLSDATIEGRATQFVVNGFLSGDTSDLFELPGGPVGFAVGAEYRRETNFYELDPISSRGYTVFNPVQNYDPPALEVKEVFAEIRLPLLSDVDFFEELTFTGAVRYADYNGATGGVLAYNAGGEWAPIRDIRFRGNYSKAVRAPLLSEAFSPISNGFIPIPADPCSLRNRGLGTANRAANCLAAGVPADYDFIFLTTPVGRFGGNPELVEEESESWTLGAVVQPRFIPGLSLSVDYYNITVTDVIGAVTAQTALNQCVDLPSIENQFCTLFERNRGPGLGPNGEIVGQPINGSFLVSSLNFAALKVRGIDFELAYRRNIEGIGVLDLRGTYTHALQNSSYASPVDPTFENVFLGELNDPQDEFLIRANLDVGQVDFTWNMRYIGKQLIGTFESINPLDGRAPTNADQFANPYYPDTVYHNVRVGFDITAKSEFYFGVDNLFNTDPPFGLTGIGAGSGIFDNRGRFFYTGVRLGF